MFIKGMKYEIRSVARIVLPMLIVFLCAAMIMSVGFMLDGRVFGFLESAEEGENVVLPVLFALAETLLGLGLVLLMAAINIAVFVLIVYRFYVSFFTDEGYLTFTLPVTVDCHLMVKIVSMFFWNIVSLLTTALGALIIFGGLSVGYTDTVKEILGDFPYLFELIWTNLTTEVEFIGAKAVLTVLTAVMTSIFQSLLLYFSIALGCMLFRKHRLLGAIVSVFCIDGIYSLVSTMGSYLLTVFGLVSEIAYLVMMGFTVVLAIVGILALYYGMRHILQKKLNLD